MPANHYGCESSKHSEFTCFDHSLQNRRFTRDRWCKTCLHRYPERNQHYGRDRAPQEGNTTPGSHVPPDAHDQAGSDSAAL